MKSKWIWCLACACCLVIGGQAYAQDCVDDSDCDDGNPCTIDFCDPDTRMCVHLPISGCEPCQTASECDDGNPCTIDECINGQCVHTPIICDDGNPCTTDFCDPATGQCLHVVIPGCGATDCGPRPDGLGCEQVTCPDPDQQCKPRCVTEDPTTGEILVTDCECRDQDACYIVWDLGIPPFCEGNCPPGEVCVTTVTTNADGTVTTCCDCQPETPVFCPLPEPPIEPLCQNLQPMQCVDGDPTTDQCLARIVFIDSNGLPVAEECSCFTIGGDCGPVLVTGTMARCPGTCPIPPYDPNDKCQVFLDGNPTGVDFVDMSTLPAGTMITCDCEQFTEPEGACCDANGLCVVVPASQCAGTYMGDGTVCLGVGACCFDADGDGIGESCARMDQLCCEQVYSGTFQGVNTACLGVGACCYDDPTGAQCVQIDEICCDDIGGSFLGLGTVCLGDSNGDGSDDACVPVDCGPTSDGKGCLPTVCPDPNDRCQPRCVAVVQGQVTVIDCECVGPEDCHVVIEPGADPFCAGDCPPGFHCEPTILPTPDGYELCCDCVPDEPTECAATPDGLACVPYVCPEPGEECKPRCARLDPATGEVLTLDCDCLAVDECYVVAEQGVQPFCEGNCPPGEECIENLIVNADGTVDLCCDCVRLPCDCPGDINGDGLVNGQDIQGFVRCLLGNPLPVDHCECADMDGDGDHDFDDVPLFVQRLLACEPCDPAPCPPEDLFIELATGVFDDGGGLIPVGTDDDTWTVTVDASGGTVPRPATIITPNSAWLTIPGTRWIAANATGPNGEYHYEFCFCLDERFKNAQLDLQLRADDRAEVFLNGVSIGATPATYAFNTPTPTMVSTNDQSLFRIGENCVTVVVTNSHGVVTGLNLAGTVSAMDGECCCDPEPLDKGLDSGVDDGDGSLLPIGVDDDTWTVTVDASGGTVPRPATTITPNPAWLTIPGTRWISAASTGPNGLYVYEYCFCLDPRWENAQLTLDLRADDNASVYLNGVLVGSTPTIYAFNTPSPTHIWVTNQSLFVPFENCIEVHVNNTHGVVTGVNIAGSITADKGLCCEDREEPLKCVPTADGQACEQAHCEDATLECLPVCVNVREGADGVVSHTVLQCECMDPSQCHIVFDTNGYAYCEGVCPDGYRCVTTELPNSTLGGVDICCRCEPLPVGACCLSIGPCIIANPQDCEVQGGVYLGDDTQCTGVEACCLPDGFCIEVEPLCCEVLHGGTPQGPGTFCLGDSDGNGIDDACEVPPTQLSCCTEDGQCIDLVPGVSDCPPGATLVVGPCGRLQACCMPDGQCLDLYEPCCLSIGGKPQGAGTDCTTVECPPQVDACRPRPDGNGCEQVECTYSHHNCHPTRVQIDPATGEIKVLACDCDNPKACQIQFNGTPFPDCKGKCPGGQQCIPVQEDNPDGTFDFWCDCGG